MFYEVVTTEIGVEISDPKLLKERISQDQCIPSGKKCIQVADPCCFTKDKKAIVDMDLLDKELSMAYNIEEGVLRNLLQHTKQSGKHILQAFVMETPVKVLYLVSKLVLNTCTVNKENNPKRVCG